jgi:hypothetical protein
MVGLVFEDRADPLAPQLLRVFSGTSDSRPNAARNVDERLGTLYRISGKNRIR